MAEFQVFRGLTPLLRARMKHFLGEFDNRDERLGAKGYYLQCRLPDKAIDQIEMSKEFRRNLAANERLPEDPETRAKALQTFREQIVLLKHRATYWLGLIAFDQGQYQVAADYFDRDVLGSSSDGPWTHGARYNLARAYESLGQTDQARRLYEADDSPQRHGNLLRSRRLNPNR